ncbi:hypothetical protein APY04_3410 [Hyphomicrobium sulfonivorans]|uniref:Uncharacterized protein n=1 Tax=Hyphomicrobium sulfonivorans TaxID=121290 RepID=A0A109B8I6_HYPSL|nr:hypothetical protein APY04_3410 [Hyphomicrobium sulfonivorans]
MWVSDHLGAALDTRKVARSACEWRMANGEWRIEVIAS